MNSLQLFGLKEYFINFVNLYKNKKLPKIILLSGDKGIGKFTLSFHLINYILSLNSKFPYNYEKLMINIDSPFYKKILLNIQENFNYIGNNYSKKIGIEDIRNIKKKFNNTPLNTLPRFTILDDVELLNINTVNALLKFIENPSAFDFFILIFKFFGILILLRVACSPALTRFVRKILLRVSIFISYIIFINIS